MLFDCVYGQLKEILMPMLYHQFWINNVICWQWKAYDYIPYIQNKLALRRELKMFVLSYKVYWMSIFTFCKMKESERGFLANK